MKPISNLLADAVKLWAARRLVRRQRCFGSGLALVLSVTTVSLQTVHAQAPSLLWTNAGVGRVFAVDEQTNVYAGTNGIVIQLSPAGIPQATNILSTYQGRAQRDTAGNYYFAGVTIPGFSAGGILVTDPPCFFAKYDSAGSLIWSNTFGPTGVTLRVLFISDLALDSDGNAYAGFSYASSTVDHTSAAAKFDTTGSNVWTTTLPKGFVSGAIRGSVRFGLISPVNGYAVTYVQGSVTWTETVSRFDSNGVVTSLAGSFAPVGATPPLVMNSGLEIYTEELTNPISGPQLLTKRNSAGSIIWQNSIGNWFTAGRDHYGGVHVADFSNQLARYDSDGNPVWSMALPTGCAELLLDDPGNRFVSLVDGTVGRLSGEIVTAPTITNAPQGITVLSGSNAVFSVGVTGSTPLRFYWIFNNTTVGTNQTLTLNTVSTSQAGFYSVIVSNFVGSVTSAPALLRIKRVAIYAGDQLLTNGTYTFAAPPTLNIRSTFPSGSTFYTLDGSPPNFGSTPYNAPFVLSQSATVRARAYSSDFLQSEEADAVNAVVLAQHTLAASSPGGGSVTLSPPGGTYSETNIVSATAVASNGWTFLHWQGDAAGTNPVINVSMERDKAVQGIFGTSLSTTIAGNGQVVVQPVRNLYPYGEIVRLTGLPQPGNYFGVWGNAASGNTNPLYFPMIVSNPTISSLFAPVPPDQAALTVMINGRGQVDVNPRANVYPTNQSVTLTAIPDPGRSFVNWAGDAGGTQNPMTVLTDQSKVITAYFHSAPALSVNHTGLEGMSPAGFRLTVLGDYPYAYQILASSNLFNWQGLGAVTNETGEVHFLDPGATNSPVRFYRAAPMP